MHTWQSAEARANGVRLHYWRTGGDKPPVVLLHGITDSGLCWSRVAEALAGDYDVIMLDARGHGQSDAPETGYTAEDHAPDVAGVIRALNLARPVLIGHSMGGATAAATAANFPDMLRAIILEDPPWGGAPDHSSAEERAARVAAWRAGIERRKAQSLDAIIAYGRKNYPDWDERDVAVWAEAKQQTSPRIASDVTGRGIRWQDVVRRISCPVLLVTADPARGAIVTPQAAAEAQQLCPRIEVAHIAGAGHNIRRDQFEPFVAVVRGYLQRAFDAPREA